MLTIQLVKDTFYAMLRDRIAAGNAARTVMVRGVARAGVLVVENELPGAAVDGISATEAFCLRWTGLAIDTQAAMPLAALTCEIRYATDGSSGLAGLDRGRALAAMDAELVAAISMAPQSAASLAIAERASGGSASEVATGTQIFWGDVAFKAAVLRGERLERTAEVEVYSYGQ